MPKTICEGSVAASNMRLMETQPDAEVQTLRLVVLQALVWSVVALNCETLSDE